MLLAHYFLTYAVFSEYDIPTKDLDNYFVYFRNRLFALVEPTPRVVPQVEDMADYEEE